MTFVGMKLTGFEGLEEALGDLRNSRSIRKAQSTALLEAGEPVAKMARSLAPKESGDMAEGIEVSTTLSRRQRKDRGLGPNEAYVYIGPKPRGPGVIEEFGTTQRNHKSGKSTGAAPAHPFMRPAWEANKASVLVNYGRYLWVTIQAEAARLGRKAKGGK